MLQTFKKWLPGEESPDRVDQTLFWLAWLLHVPHLFFLPIAVARGLPRAAFGNVMSLGASLVPRWMESRSSHRFPPLGEFSLSLAMFIEMLGRTLQYYATSTAEQDAAGMKSYDSYSHLLEVAGVSTFFTMLIYAYLADKELESPDWVVMGVGSMMGLGAAGLWEIYEWTADQMVKAGFQYGNDDTMTDLVLGALGAWFGAVAAQHYVGTRTREQLAEDIRIFYEL